MELIEKLRAVKEKFEKINEQLSDPDIVNNQEKLIALSKERSELIEVVEAFDKYDMVLRNIEGNREIIEKGDDRELAEMAESELEELKSEKEKLEEEIKYILIPKDPNDNKDVIVEVRAGTGGDEAGLFAFDLYRMYSRFAEVKGWKKEIIDISESGLGGIKEVVFSLNGQGVYGDLKFENGVHRVQELFLVKLFCRIQQKR
jgi:peptide chain release factor 1